MMNLAGKKTLCALSVALFLFAISALPVTKSLLAIWYNDTSFYHGFLVIPLFCIGWLVKSELFDVYPIRFEPLTMPLLAIVTSLMMVAFFGGFNIIAHFFFVMCLIIIVVASFGRHIVKRNMALVVFLCFAIPFGTEFIIPLQNLTANISVFLLRISGISVIHEGINIITPNARFYVAEACAGLRFLIANVFVCYIFAYFNFHKKKSWIIFGIVSLLIPIIGNCLRAYMIMMIGHYTSGEYASGVDHIVYGWGFFSLLAFLNLVIGDRIAKSEGLIETDTAPMIPFGVYDATRDKFYAYAHFYEKRIFLSFLIILLIPAVLNHYFNTVFATQKYSPIPELTSLLPLKIKEEMIPTDTLITHFKNTDYQIAYRYDATTTFQISYYRYQNESKEVTSSLNALHNEDNRFLLSQRSISHKGNTYHLTVTGHVDGQKYISLSRYFYQSDTSFHYTDSKLAMQYYSLMNLLYKGHNAGGILIIDKAISPSETEQQAIDNLLKIV